MSTKKNSIKIAFRQKQFRQKSVRQMCFFGEIIFDKNAFDQFFFDEKSGNRVRCFVPLCITSTGNYLYLNGVNKDIV